MANVQPQGLIGKINLKANFTNENGYLMRIQALQPGKTKSENDNIEL